jgi:hypothetical protein
VYLLCWSGSIRCKSGSRKRMQAFGSLPRRSLNRFCRQRMGICCTYMCVGLSKASYRN